MTFFLGEELKRLRDQTGETQRQFYGRLHVTRQSGSAYEREATPVPYETACHMVQRLRSARLAVMAMSQAGINVMPIPLMDRIDYHPQTVLNKFREELREGAEAGDINVVLTMNKRERQDFTDAEWDDFEGQMQQIIDVYVAALMLFVMANEHFGWDPWAAAKRAYTKYRGKRYITYSPERATVAVGGD